MQDYSMLELFRQEVTTQVTNLRQSLLILKRQPSLINELDAALRSLHAISGSAQLVDVEAAAKLSEALQTSLLAVQNHAVELTEPQIDQWLDAVTLLSEISDASDRLDSWLAKHSADLAAIHAALYAPSKESSTSQNRIQPEKSLPSLSAIVEVEENPSEKYKNATSLSPALSVGENSMLDLFRLEVDAQAMVLTNGLVALETQPASASDLEALMRAAHSIKGAARIIGLDAAVGVAHVMEDSFVAAQNQAVTLRAEHIDALLRGVDFLQTISQLSDRDLPHWLEKNDLAIAAIRAAISAIVHPEEAPAVVVEAALSPILSAASVQPDHASISTLAATELETPVAPATPDRVIRVNAENLARIMGLAGESLIAANWLPSFVDALRVLKTRQNQLAKSLEILQQELPETLTPESQASLETASLQERDCRTWLSDRLTDLESFVQRNNNLSDRLYREVITTNMRPFEDGVQSFPRMVRDISRQLNKQVKLEIIGKSTSVDRDILQKLEAPLTHILRNALDHGIEMPEERLTLGKPAEGTVRLEACHRGGMLSVAIADDGKGIDLETLRHRVIDQNLAPADVAAKMTDAELMEFLFLPGFSLTREVTELSGRGVGLDIAKSMTQEVGGTVRASSYPGKGTSFLFQLPLTLSVIRTLLVEIAGESYAFPLARIDRVITLPPDAITPIENRPYFTLDGKNIGLISVAQVLELPTTPLPDAPIWVVTLSDAAHTYGLWIDRCLGEHELVVRPLDSRLGKVPDISAAALMEDGSLVLIIDVADLVQSINTLLTSNRLLNVSIPNTVGHQSGEMADSERDLKRVLVVDDSITVREMERKLLQNRGYRVEVAVDGMEGWNAVRAQPYDLVISDIDMPRMNGIELIQQIKQHPRLKTIPVIVVSYRDREEDRLQGLEAGADYYLTKSSFHDDTLIEAVIDLIGE
jgi:two-component system, chemotaxis family, sensor histidine kinase and response regulator WspE